MRYILLNPGKNWWPGSVLAYASIKIRNNVTKISEFIHEFVYAVLISLMYSRMSLFIVIIISKAFELFQKDINVIHCFSECNYSPKWDSVKQICYKYYIRQRLIPKNRGRFPLDEDLALGKTWHDIRGTSPGSSGCSSVQHTSTTSKPRTGHPSFRKNSMRCTCHYWTLKLI